MKLLWHNIVTRFIDHEPTSRWLHTGIRHGQPLNHARAKLLMAYSTSMCFAAPVASVPYFQRGLHEIGWITLGFGLLALAPLPLMRLSPRLWLAPQPICFALYGCCITGVAVLGGVHAPSTPWLAFIPAIALVFGSARLGTLWFAIVLITYMSLRYAELNRSFQPRTVFNPQDLEVFTVITTLSFFIALWGFALSIDGMRHWLDARAQRHEASLQESNDALRLARDEAQRASLAKSRFLANMSHELRTPLTAVIGYSELLQEELHERHIRDLDDDLGAIGAASRDLIEIIADILDLTKIEASTISLHIATIQLLTFAQEMSAVAKTLAVRNNNTLTLHIDPTLHDTTIISDAHKLRRIILNFISNAAKFTEHGAINLHFTPHPDRQDALQVRITDTGIGIPQTLQESVWQEFTQADDSSTRRYGGAGLGLTIARRFANALQIELALQSTEGVGTQITLTIPHRVALPRIES